MQQKKRKASSSSACRPVGILCKREGWALKGMQTDPQREVSAQAAATSSSLAVTGCCDVSDTLDRHRDGSLSSLVPPLERKAAKPASHASLGAGMHKRTKETACCLPDFVFQMLAQERKERRDFIFHTLDFLGKWHRERHKRTSQDSCQDAVVYAENISVCRKKKEKIGTGLERQEKGGGEETVFFSEEKKKKLDRVQL